MRDPNERMYMSGLGIDSPMFDYVEQICGRSSSGVYEDKKQSKMNKEILELERKAKSLKETDDIANAENIEFEDNQDDNTLALAKVD